MSGAHAGAGYKSRTLATWVAVIGGSLGLHRFYLNGLRDPWGWLFIPPTVCGLIGVQRMKVYGVDDHLAWVLIPFLGLTIAIGMLFAIVYGLTPDERWNARYNPTGPQHQVGWAAIIGVVLALVIGGGVLMATLAFSAQRYFEYQAETRADVQTKSIRPTQ
jgi:hypothetical protein